MGSKWNAALREKAGRVRIMLKSPRTEGQAWQGQMQTVQNQASSPL